MVFPDKYERIAEVSAEFTFPSPVASPYTIVSIFSSSPHTHYPFSNVWFSSCFPLIPLHEHAYVAIWSVSFNFA